VDNTAGADLRPLTEGATLRLRNWPARRIAIISLTWVILVAAYSLWRQYSSSYISRLRGSNIEGLVIISDEPSLAPILLAAFVPPLVLLVTWGAYRKRRH
jgi:hypothetical protein